MKNFIWNSPSQILGIDIDKDLLIQEERINSYQCDQTDSESIVNFCKAASIKKLSIDIIIDDGLHQFFAGKSLFENMNKYLSRDGLYIIEDVNSIDYAFYKDYFSKNSEFSVKFLNLARPSLYIQDNRLVIIKKN